MTMYAYKALTAEARKVSGSIEASSRREANEILRARGIHVTNLSAAEASGGGAGRRVSGRRLEQTFLFTSFMRRLLRARLPAVEALEAAASELDGYSLGAVVERVRGRVGGGSGLADALAMEGDFFDDLYVAMIEAAESSGTLGEAFDTIYAYERRSREFRKKLVSALAYPVILLGVSVMAVAFLLSYVVPKISAALVTARIPLPVVTKVLIGVGDVARVWWPVAAAVAVVAVFTPRILRSFAAGRVFFDRVLVEAPVARKFARAAAVGRFSRTLSALLKTGLRVADGLEIAGRVSRNSAYEKAVTAARGRIISGSDLAASLAESGLFPGYAVQIVGIGERTGTLAESFEEIAISEEEALETAAERFLSLLEPGIIVVMAVVVGFIVASVLLPILSISAAAI